MENRPKILIVEDDPEIRLATNLRLRKNGFEIVEACDGVRAIDQAIATSPDLIVMDLRMPCMGGLDAIRKLQTTSSTADIPIVVISASVGDENASLDAGAKYFLKKPFESRELILLIQFMLRHHKKEAIG